MAKAATVRDWAEESGYEDVSKWDYDTLTDTTVHRLPKEIIEAYNKANPDDPYMPASAMKKTTAKRKTTPATKKAPAAKAAPAVQTSIARVHLGEEGIIQAAFLERDIDNGRVPSADTLRLLFSLTRVQLDELKLAVKSNLF